LRGKCRAGILDISFEAVLRFEDHVAGLQVDLQNTGKSEWGLTDDRKNRCAVRRNSNQIRADVPEAVRVVVRRRRECDVESVRSADPVPSPEDT
jgi:hypothetical protein